MNRSFNDSENPILLISEVFPGFPGDKFAIYVNHVLWLILEEPSNVGSPSFFAAEKILMGYDNVVREILSVDDDWWANQNNWYPSDLKDVVLHKGCAGSYSYPTPATQNYLSGKDNS